MIRKLNIKAFFFELPVSLYSSKKLKYAMRKLILVITDQKSIITMHCCYQGAFQEVNILTNRAHLFNVKFILTESSYEKNYFLKTVKVISNLMNVLGTSFPGQTYVQKWLFNYGHFYGQNWPFLTLMAIFYH